MKGLFGFLDMDNNYEQRKVSNTVINNVEIDTVLVTDSSKDYETGICSSLYNGNKWVIVELYNTKEQAVIGHNNWVKKFSNKKRFPKFLEDVSTCSSAIFLRNIAPERRIKPKKQLSKRMI